MALDQRIASHHMEQEPADERGPFARKAKPVVQGPVPNETAKDWPSRLRRLTLGHALAICFSLAVAGVSIYILGRTFSAVGLGALRQAIGATSLGQIGQAVLLTALSFLALTGYDGLALFQLGSRVRYKTAALASFTSYAISFTLGFPLITAGTVRYLIYSQAGLTAAKVATLTVIAGVTFWLGNIFVLGTGLMFHARALSAIDHLFPFLNFLLGLLVVGAILAYLVWVTIRRRTVSIRGFRLELPGLFLTMGQISLGVIDQSAAAGALYVLLPGHESLNFFAFAAIYVFACLLGVASNAPGGIGVFEAAMLNALPIASQDVLLASLVLFRVIYYLLPFLAALALLGAHHGFRQWKSLRAAMRQSEEEVLLEDEINPLRHWDHGSSRLRH